MQSKILKRAVFGAIGSAAVLLAGAAQAVGVSGQGIWETTLLGRDGFGQPVDASSDSARFLYDTVLDITWLRDANWAKTSGYAPENGAMTWDQANTWANTLKAGYFGRYSGWRLPTIVDTGLPGCDYSTAGNTDCGYNVQFKSGDPTNYQAGQTVYSEMAHLWYVTLGNKGYCPPLTFCTTEQPGWGLSNTGSFQNLQADVNWSGTEYAADPGSAWGFYTSAGPQYYYLQHNAFYAMAVRPGDVAAVPEPQAYALMLMGLGALMLTLRRRLR
jgi:hypothetical protein